MSETAEYKLEKFISSVPCPALEYREIDGESHSNLFCPLLFACSYVILVHLVIRWIF